MAKYALNCGVQCHICGLRNDKGTCKNCRRKTPLKALFAAGQYEDPILKEMIHYFKYQSIESLKKPLAQTVFNYLEKENLTDKLKNSVLIPIPLTLRRKVSRGFNQSELLAKELSPVLNCPVVNLLKRKKFTAPQAEISDWQKRKENISGVFCISMSSMSSMSDINSSTIDVGHRYNHQYKKVILVDDVSTSGATLEEAARILKEAGNKRNLWIGRSQGINKITK